MLTLPITSPVRVYFCHESNLMSACCLKHQDQCPPGKGESEFAPFEELAVRVRAHSYPLCKTEEKVKHGNINSSNETVKKPSVFPRRMFQPTFLGLWNSTGDKRRQYLADPALYKVISVCALSKEAGQTSQQHSELPNSCAVFQCHMLADHLAETPCCNYRCCPMNRSDFGLQAYKVLFCLLINYILKCEQ